jgi:HSP20 family protein
MTDQEISVRNKQEVSREEPTRSGRAYQPDVDIYETPERLWLWVDMPGVDEKNVNVDLANGVLTIEGTVALDDYNELAPVYTEYNVGNYVRRFSISSDVDLDGIKARTANGVLELELPKTAKARPRKITVTTP